jgi:hypothetical protein
MVAHVLRTLFVVTGLSALTGAALKLFGSESQTSQKVAIKETLVSEADSESLLAMVQSGACSLGIDSFCKPQQQKTQNENKSDFVDDIGESLDNGLKWASNTVENAYNEITETTSNLFDRISEQLANIFEDDDKQHAEETEGNDNDMVVAANNPDTPNFNNGNIRAS